MKTIEIIAFIKPNASVEFKEDMPQSIVTKAKRLLDVDIKVGDQLVELQFTPKNKTKAIDNLASYCWHFHGVLGVEKPGQKDRIYAWIFSTVLVPKSLFMGVKEGDKRTFDCPKYEAKIEVTFQQQGYRYQRFGNFEDVLSKI